MSDSDKTRQKLVDTIRRTREGAAEKPAEVAPPAEKTAAVKKASVARKRRAGNAQPERRAAEQVQAGTAKSTVDAYQSGGRVWPD
jgi:uncharacterized protein (DUF4415 family)